MDFDSDQESITPHQQQYIKIDTTGALWLPTGTNGQRPSSPSQGHIRYNTDTPGLEHWTGATWSAIGGGGSGTSGDGVVEVAYFFPASICSVILNESTMVIDLSTKLTSLVGASGFPAYAVGQLCYVQPAADSSKEGIYTLGSVASLSAVTLTRHADWPASRLIPRETEVFVNYHPENLFSGTFFSSGSVASASVNTTTDTLLGTSITKVNQLILISDPGSGAVAPAGLSYGSYYYTVFANASGDIQLSATYGGSVINITSAGTNGGSGNCLDYATKVGSFAELSSTLKLYAGFTQDDTGWSFSTLGATAVKEMSVKRRPTDDLRGGAILGGAAFDYRSLAVGQGSVTFGGFSTAVGYGAYVNGDGGVAVGTAAITDRYGVAIGNNAIAGSHSIAIGYNALSESTESIVIQTGGGGGYSLNANQPNTLSIGQGDILAGSGTLGLLYAKGTVGTADATETPIVFGDSLYSTSAAFYKLDAFGSWRLSGYLTAQDPGPPSIDSVVWKIDGIVSLNGSSTVSDVQLTRVASTVSTIAKSLKARLSVDWHAGSSSVRLTCNVTGAAATVLQWWLYVGGVFQDSRYSINENLGAPVAIKTGSATTITTSEALSAGNLVNIHSSSGIKCRKASSSLGYEAHGYVLEDVSSSGAAVVYTTGENPYLSGLTTGDRLFLSTTGGVTATMPSAGDLVQIVGTAMSTTKMNVLLGVPIQT